MRFSRTHHTDGQHGHRHWDVHESWDSAVRRAILQWHPFDPIILSIPGENSMPPIFYGHGTLPTGKKGEAMLVAEGGPRVLAAKYRDWLEKFHNEERNFYIRAGVNYKILERADQQVKKNPGKPDEYKLDEKTAEYTYTTTPSVWVPQRATLEKYGVNGQQYFQKYTTEMVQDAMKKVGIKSAFVLEK